jgi:hypothetical protein
MAKGSPAARASADRAEGIRLCETQPDTKPQQLSKAVSVKRPSRKLIEITARFLAPRRPG